MKLEHLIFLGGVCHFGILLASALVPRVLDWKTELQRLSALSRHLIWTHGVFIVLVIIAFGAISVLCTRDLAQGTRLARAFCAFVSIFWLARLAIQLFLFDAKPYLRTSTLKAGYHALTGVFAYLAVVYGWAAVGGAL